MVNHDTSGNALSDTTQAIAYTGTDGTTPATLPNQAGTTTTTNPALGTATQTPTYTDPAYSNKNAGNTISRKTSTTGPLATGFTLSGGGKLCIDDASSSTTPGNKIQVYTCNNTTAQSWTVGTDGTVKVLGMCLDTTSNATTAGTLVVIDTCSSDATQKWKATTTGTLVSNANTAMCLTDPAANATKGTQITLATCGSTGQTWTTIGTGALPPGQTQTLTYDAEGRTATVATPSGTTTNTSKYLYDADGNLLEQTSTVGTTDKTRILYLFGGAEQITLNVAAKTWTGLRNYTGPDGTVITRSSSGTVTYQVANAQGTATTAIDASTLAVTRRSYDPWGNPRGAKPSTWIAPDENHGFLGQPTDTTTGLNLLGARNYDPTLGRFLTPDPLFEAGDPNQMGGYTYAADNPATGSDPTGLWSFGSLAAAAISATQSAASAVSTAATSMPDPTATSSGNTVTVDGYSVGGISDTGKFVNNYNSALQSHLSNFGNSLTVQDLRTQIAASLTEACWDDETCADSKETRGSLNDLYWATQEKIVGWDRAPGEDIQTAPRVSSEEAAAAASVSATAAAVRAAESDAADMAAAKRAGEQARAEAADAEAAKPASPETGASGAASGSHGRGVTARGNPGAKSRPAYIAKESAPAGWTPAGQAARGDELARNAAVENRTARTAARSYASGYHVDTGEIAVASSGPGITLCGASFCAEGNVVQALGGDWTKVRFGMAFVAERLETGEFAATGKYVCDECAVDYVRSSFGPNVAGRPDGPWYKRP
uniref:ricin-type beta-trefoil lectin domain protein n=1 Tax=Peterkaempfera podocarpi TaxID=3232308 RepID=UPI003F576B8D